MICCHEAAKEDLTSLRNAALLSIMSDGLLRVSEVVRIQWSDIEQADGGTGSVLIRQSKTDPEAAGAVLFLSARSMRLIQRYSGKAQITEGALLRRHTKGPRVTVDGLTPRSARRLIRGMFQRWQSVTSLSEHTDSYISGHSLRVGTAKSLVAKGAHLPEVMQAVRWSSSRMPAHYTRKERAAYGAVARHLAIG